MQQGTGGSAERGEEEHRWREGGREGEGGGRGLPLKDLVICGEEAKKLPRLALTPALPLVWLYDGT